MMRHRTYVLYLIHETAPLKNFDRSVTGGPIATRVQSLTHLWDGFFVIQLFYSSTQSQFKKISL